MTTPSIPLIVKFDQWPEADRDLWNGALISGGLFDNRGAFSAWSNGTRQLHRQNYGSWLSFLKRKMPQLLNLPFSERITRETISAFIDDGQERLKPRSISNQLLTLAVLARSFAPDDDWAWLYRVSRAYHEQSDPHRLKKPIPISAADIFEWSLMRLNQLEADHDRNTVRVAVQYRQALMVGLLIARPIRVRAFMAMTIDRHLELTDHAFTLSFAPEEMKDKRPRRFPFPAPLIPFLHKYLQIYRLHLLQDNVSNALWISQRGNPMHIDSFTSGLAQLTSRVFGLTLRPHAFRHIAATSIASAAPEHVGIIREILGHATLRTSEQHYNRATGVEASRRLQNVLREFRSEERRAQQMKRRHRLQDRQA